MAGKINQNAQDALGKWRLTVQYQPDPDAGVTPHDLINDAACVMRLAESQGIALEELVPDEKERKELMAFAAEYTTGVDEEYEYYKRTGMEFSLR